MVESSDKSKKGNNVPADVERAPAPPLVLINSPWLTGVTNRIRSRPIPWEGYARADLVSQDELKMIRSVDGKDQSEAERVLDERGEDYAVLYLRLLGKLSRTDTLQQVLVLIGDMLEGRDDRVGLFFKAAKKAKGSEKGKGEDVAWPWAPLIKVLDVADDFAQLKAAQFLTLLLVAPTTSYSSTLTTAPTSVITRLLTFLSKLINSTTSSGASTPAAGAGLLRPPTSGDTYADGNGADIAIQLLESLLRTQQFRREVWKDEMRRQSETPTTEEKEVKKDDEDKENGEDETQKKKIKHGQSPGLIRGLVYILQAALVAPQGAQSSTPSSSNGNDEQGEGSSSRNSGNAKSSPVTPQMQYQVIFCFWLLSFSESISEDINRKFSIVPLLVDVARGAVKEKVIRITIATLKNLLLKAPSQNGPVMLGSKLLPLVEILSERKWSDEELEEDLKFLASELEEKLKGMSSYDEYLSELSSGKLSWDNPAHELDDFWKANGQKLLEPGSSSSTSEEASADSKKDAEEDDEEGDGEKTPRTGLTRLISLLKSSSDAVTLSVALHDIGKLIQFTESGRRRVNQSKGGKVEIMKLISHEDTEVKFRALNTVGKLMSESWR